MELNENVYNTNDIAKILKVSYAHANNLMHSDKLDTFDVGIGGKESHLRITETNLRKFMEGKNETN